MLTLKKVWDFGNGALFYQDHFTADGFETYWKSVDSAIQFWDRHLWLKGKVEHSREAEKIDRLTFFMPRRRTDNYHWSSRNFRGHKLPTPPRFNNY